MASNNKFDRLVNSRGYMYLSRIFSVITINFLFCLMSVLSLFVLFFPGLVAMHTVCYQIAHNEEYRPIQTFFEEIKKQWSFMWRLEVFGIIVILTLSGMAYLYYAYEVNMGLDIFLWIGIIFEICLGVCFVCLLMHLLTFNNYFKNDTFIMMIRKSALIARTKMKKTILMLVLFIAFVVLDYLLPFLVPFLGFMPFILILEYLNRGLYTELYLQEQKREEEMLALEIENNEVEEN